MALYVCDELCHEIMTRKESKRNIYLYFFLNVCTIYEDFDGISSSP